MGKGTLKPLIGSALLVASFVIAPYVSPMIAGFMFSAGTSIVAAEIFGQSLSDRQGALLSNPLSAQAELAVVYGIARIGIAFADARTHPTDEKILYVVGAIAVASEAGGGIDNITKVYFDDRVAINSPTTTGALGTTGIQSPWNSGSRLAYAIHLGTDAQTVDSELNTQFATAWPSTSKGAGMAYIVLKMKFDQEVYSGVPNITAIVKGQKVYDPRSATTAWSDNPALCIRDYLTSTKYGCAVPSSELNEQSFIDAANYCDELVNTTAVNQKRFTCNGAVDTSRPRLDTLTELLSSCRGQVIYESGKFKLAINAPSSATAFKLNEDNIIGDWEFLRGGSSVPNSITARFIDPNWNYQPREVTWPEAGQANGFLTADNSHLSPQQIDLPFTDNYYRAQQIAMTLLREAREDITVVLTAKQEALKLVTGDVVPLTHTTPAFTDKNFRVVAMALMPDATVRPVLREYDINAYTLDTQNTDPTPTGSGLPNPFTVSSPSALTLTANSTTALITQGGDVNPRIKLGWTPSTHAFVDHYEIEFKRTADSVWTPVAPALKDETEAYIWPVSDATPYDVRIRAVNTIGVPSSWVSTSVTTSTKPGQARIAQATMVWEENVDKLRVIITGGQYIGSCLLQIASVPDLSGGVFQTSGWLNVVEGDQVNFLSNAMAASDRDRPWYVGIFPNNAAAGAGDIGEGVFVSTRVEGNKIKDAKIAADSFRGTDPSFTTVHDYINGYLLVKQGNTVDYYQAPLELADGVEITAFAARLYRGSATNDVALIKLFEQTDTGVTQIGSTGTHSGTGWSDVAVTITATPTTGKTFFLRAELYSMTSSPPDIRLAWGRVTYTMPTIDNTR